MQIRFTLFTLPALISAGAAAFASDTAFTGFTDPNNLVVNGDAQIIHGEPEHPTLLRLTPPKRGKAGSIFSQEMIRSTSFSTYFQFRITESGGSAFDCNESHGADGLVFVIQSVSSDLGSTGQGIGYGGIERSIGIEFDTWCNSGNQDPCANHVAINLKGSVYHEDPNDVVSVEDPFENGEIWHVWVDYDGKMLEVRVSLSEDRPHIPTLLKEVDIESVLESTHAYIGFTSGTGACWAQHDILLWEHRDTYAPVQTGSTLQVLSPAHPVPHTRSPSASPDATPLLVILDASASMLLTLPTGESRMQVAKTALERLIANEIPEGHPVGIRVFGHRGGANCVSQQLLPIYPLDRGSTLEKVRQIRSSSLGNTALAESLAKAQEDFASYASQFKSRNQPGKIILLTDGEETCGGDPLRSITTMIEEGFEVKLDIVGFAVESETLRATFQSWVQVANGQYFDSTALDELTESLALAASNRASDAAAPTTYDVIDASGKRVLSGTVNGPELPIPPGTYLVRVSGADGTVTELEAVVTQGKRVLQLP
ncbi:MAG: VWA domain-containing protein [Puniceicoccaceae bacterium]